MFFFLEKVTNNMTSRYGAESFDMQLRYEKQLNKVG